MVVGSSISGRGKKGGRAESTPVNKSDGVGVSKRA